MAFYLQTSAASLFKNISNSVKKRERITLYALARIYIMDRKR